jgi:hypothetical protein
VFPLALISLSTLVYQTLVCLRRQFRSDCLHHILDVGERLDVGRAGPVAIFGTDRPRFGHRVQPHQITLFGKLAAIRLEAADGDGLLLIGNEDTGPFGTVAAILGATVDTAAIGPLERQFIFLRDGDPAALRVDRALIFARCRNARLLRFTLVRIFLQRGSNTVIDFAKIRACQEDDDSTEQQSRRPTCCPDTRVALALNQQNSRATGCQQRQRQH